MRRRGVRACGTRAKLGGIHTRLPVLRPTHNATVATGRHSVQPVASPPLSPPTAHARHHPRPPSPAGPARSAP
jgi:hypothetical protein